MCFCRRVCLPACPTDCLTDCLPACLTDWLTVGLFSRCLAEGNRIFRAQQKFWVASSNQVPISMGWGVWRGGGVGGVPPTPLKILDQIFLWTFGPSKIFFYESHQSTQCNPGVRLNSMCYRTTKGRQALLAPLKVQHHSEEGGGAGPHPLTEALPPPPPAHTRTHTLLPDSSSNDGSSSGSGTDSSSRSSSSSPCGNRASASQDPTEFAAQKELPIPSAKLGPPRDGVQQPPRGGGSSSTTTATAAASSSSSSRNPSGSSRSVPVKEPSVQGALGPQREAEFLTEQQPKQAHTTIAPITPSQTPRPHEQSPLQRCPSSDPHSHSRSGKDGPPNAHKREGDAPAHPSPKKPKLSHGAGRCAEPGHGGEGRPCQAPQPSGLPRPTARGESGSSVPRPTARGESGSSVPGPCTGTGGASSDSSTSRHPPKQTQEQVPQPRPAPPPAQHLKDKEASVQEASPATHTGTSSSGTQQTPEQARHPHPAKPQPQAPARASPTLVSPKPAGHGQYPPAQLGPTRTANSSSNDGSSSGSGTDSSSRSSSNSPCGNRASASQDPTEFAAQKELPIPSAKLGPPRDGVQQPPRGGGSSSTTTTTATGTSSSGTQQTPEQARHPHPAKPQPQAPARARATVTTPKPAGHRQSQARSAWATVPIFKKPKPLAGTDQEGLGSGSVPQGPQSQSRTEGTEDRPGSRAQRPPDSSPEPPAKPRLRSPPPPDKQWQLPPAPSHSSRALSPRGSEGLPSDASRARPPRAHRESHEAQEQLRRPRRYPSQGQSGSSNGAQRPSYPHTPDGDARAQPLPQRLELQRETVQSISEELLHAEASQRSDQTAAWLEQLPPNPSAHATPTSASSKRADQWQPRPQVPWDNSVLQAPPETDFAAFSGVQAQAGARVCGNVGNPRRIRPFPAARQRRHRGGSSGKPNGRTVVWTPTTTATTASLVVGLGHSAACAPTLVMRRHGGVYGPWCSGPVGAGGGGGPAEPSWVSMPMHRPFGRAVEMDMGLKCRRVPCVATKYPPPKKK